MNTKRRFAMSVLGLGVLVALLVGIFQVVTLLPKLPATWQVQECAYQMVHLNGTAPATVTCVQKRLETFQRQQNGAYVLQSSTLLTQLGPQSSGLPADLVKQAENVSDAMLCGVPYGWEAHGGSNDSSSNDSS